MRATEQRRAREAGRMVALAALAVAMLQGTAYAQQGPGSGPAQPGAKQDAGTGAEATLGRAVAMVNGDLILESYLEDEERLAVFQPLTRSPAVSREQLLYRLI